MDSSYEMHCPKCGGTDYSITRDNLRSPTVDETFSLVFSCRCGKQLFGQQVVEEWERQKKEFEVNDQARVEAEREREARIRQEQERKAAMEKAMAYRREYLRRKRLEAEEEARREREERDRRWRERVAAEDARDDDEGDHDDEEDEDEEFGEDTDKDESLCAWGPCTNLRRPNSKYCSRDCSNKNARYRYRQRRRRESRKSGSQEDSDSRDAA